MELHTTLRRVVPIAALATATLAIPGEHLDAQELTYTTVSDVELGGTLGRLMRVMPGDQNEVRETVRISGARSRTDTEGTSTILDFEAGRYVVLDHETRSYWQIDLTELDEAVAQASEAMARSADQTGAEAARRRGDLDSDDTAARLEIEISTERTGDRREISGLSTERVFVVLEMTAEELAVTDDPDRPELKEGTVVLLNELWLTAEPLAAVPENLDMEDYRELTADAMDEWAALAQLWADHPDLQLAFDRSRAALDDLGGMAVESTFFWVTVPPDKDFDLEAALADRDRSLLDDLADAAKESAKESARSAVKKGIGGLGGGLFGGGDDEAEEEEPELVQETFLRIRTRLEEMDRGDIPESTFEIPEGYTERHTDAGGA